MADTLLVRNAVDMPKPKRKATSKATNEDDEQPSSKRPRQAMFAANDVAEIEDYDIDFRIFDNVKHLYVEDLVILVPEDEKGHLLLDLDIKKHRISLSKYSNQDLEVHGNSSIPGESAAAAAVELSTTPALSRSRDNTKDGFLNLPAELRDLVYSEIFVSKCYGKVSPSMPEDSSLSAALLRTCRQVYNEGRKWLYSENSFCIGRDWRSRGGIWEARWSCVGYETMHTFFKTIGNINMSLLREVSIHLYDATPTDMPHSQPEDRRYIYDRQLLGIVKLLAENTNLRKVQVIVDGRKKLGRQCEMPFFTELSKVKANEVEITGLAGSQPTKIDASTLAFLRKNMQRQRLSIHDEDEDEDSDDI